MRRFGSALLTLCVTAGMATASDQEITETVAVVRDARHPADGVWVATSGGHRRLLKGKLALTVAKDTEVFTVTGRRAQRVIHVNSIQGKVLEGIGGGRFWIPKGSDVQILAAEQTDDGFRYSVLAGRYPTPRWIFDHQIELKPKDPPMVYSSVLGTVMKDERGGTVIQSALGRTRVMGATTSLLKPGTEVSGYGLHFIKAKRLLLTELHGTTTTGTHVRKDRTSDSDSMPFAPQTTVLISGGGPGGVLRIKFNWPGSDTTLAYIPRKDVRIGRPVETITGEVTQLAGALAIKKPDGGIQGLRLGGTGALPDRLLRSHLGKTVTISAVPDRDGHLRVRALRAVIPYGLPKTPYRPAIKGGTVVDVRADLLRGEQLLVTLPSGKGVLVPRIALDFPPRTGAAAILDGLR